MGSIKKSSRGLAVRKSKGFTLIEILVVIGIIAILASIVIVAINPAKQFRQARDSQRTANTNAILNGIGQYIADHKGNFPAPLTTSYAIQTISDTGSNLCAQLVPEYLPALPADPATTGPVTNCGAAYNIGYKVSVDATGRVTVYADREDPTPTIPAGAAGDIRVTR